MITIPKFLLHVGNPRGLFLAERPFIDQPRETQKILSAIWSISHGLLGESNHEISFKMPSRRLLELGLAPEDKADAILEKISKREELGEPDFNLITLQRKGKAFQIVKTHLTGKNYRAEDGEEIRRDDIIEETLILQRNGGVHIISTGERVTGTHFHIGNRRYIEKEDPKEIRFQ